MSLNAVLDEAGVLYALSPRGDRAWELDGVAKAAGVTEAEVRQTMIRENWLEGGEALLGFDEANPKAEPAVWLMPEAVLQVLMDAPGPLGRQVRREAIDAIGANAGLRRKAREFLRELGAAVPLADPLRLVKEGA